VAVSYRSACASIIDPGQFSQHDIRPARASLPPPIFTADSARAANDLQHLLVILLTYKITALLRIV
jgi:hypothetical protein